MAGRSMHGAPLAVELQGTALLLPKLPLLPPTLPAQAAAVAVPPPYTEGLNYELVQLPQPPRLPAR